MPEPVLLGYSDGSLDLEDEECNNVDPFMCRLGGQPIWLDNISNPPSYEKSAVCGQCGSNMAFLAQTYVPLSDSPFDRVLYIWACNRQSCTGKPGAATAIRGQLLNVDYARKLLRRHSSTKSKHKAKDIAPVPVLDFGSVWHTKSMDSSDPAKSTTIDKDKLFTGPLFGNRNANTSLANLVSEDGQPIPSVDLLANDLGKLNVIQTAGDALKWPTNSDGFPPAHYLEFDKEVLERDGDGRNRVLEKYKEAIGEVADMLQHSDDIKVQKGYSRKGQQQSSSGSGKDDWLEETYERATRAKGTDSAFERFTKLVSQNPAQVIRYQHGGTPLLYTLHDKTSKMLLGSSYGSTEDIDSEDDEDDEEGTVSNEYTTASLPKCPFCGGRRVFEMQLMPALLSELSLFNHIPKQPKSSTSNSQPRLMGKRLLDSVDLGMEFGTILVFVCENDCHKGKTGLDCLAEDTGSVNQYIGAVYHPELVLVQLENHVD